MTRYSMKNDPEIIDKIRKLISEGLNVREISEKINISPFSVTTVAKKNNIKYLTRGPQYLKKDWSLIITDYEAGVQAREIGEKYGLSRKQLNNHMNRRGIKRPLDFKPSMPKRIQNRYNWSAIALDFEGGMQVDDICEKHNIGEQYLSWGMKDRGVKRPPWYKRNQVNPPRKNQVIIDKIKFLAAENLTKAGIARVIKFTLDPDQIPDYPLDISAIENICTQHQITTKG